MSAYADTAFICSLYLEDAHTPFAGSWMNRPQEPLPFTWLHQIEVKNALRLRVFRKEDQAEQCAAALALLSEDFQLGIWQSTILNPAAVTLKAEQLSARHTAHIGTRSLDILHVAAALVLGVTDFLTFDKRQATLAMAAGLKSPKLI